jgi:probable O-glycosylation ligase (exosortase A-associated)
MRDIVLTAVVMGALPACFMRPWVGIMMWCWLGFMNPHRMTWGFAYSIPFAQLVAIATLLGLLFDRTRKPIPRTPEVGFLLALWAMFGVSTIFAYYPDNAFDSLMKISKILFMTVVAMSLLQDSYRMKWLLVVTGASFGFFGLKGGIFALATGSQHHVLGPEGSFIAGNTEIGLALNMTLPILLFLYKHEERRWLRYGWLAMFVMSFPAILSTYSRGALLGLGVVLPMLFLKAKQKLVVIVLLAVSIPTAMAILPEKWYSRMETIQTYEQDGSAQGRLRAWQLAMQIANDRPLTGGGFRTFSKELYAYYGWATSAAFDAHSIYFQVLAEHGYPGLLLFLGLIVATMVSLRMLIHTRPRDPANAWIPECARMLEASMAGYLICGAFLSLSYFDLLYTLVAATAILRVLVRQAPAAQPAEEAPVPAPARTMARVPALGRRSPVRS